MESHAARRRAFVRKMTLLRAAALRPRLRVVDSGNTASGQPFVAERKAPADSERELVKVFIEKQASRGDS